MKRNKTGIWILAGVMLAAGLPACVSKKNLISPFGLDMIQLGEPLPAVGVSEFKKTPAKDTVFMDGEYQWRATVLLYEDGNVFLEEDFYQSADLSRIRIETTKFKLKNGLKVGTTVGELVEKDNKWYINPLKDYNVFDFYSRKFPNIHFLVSDPSNPMENPDWQTYTPDQFDQNAKISSIVIH